MTTSLKIHKSELPKSIIKEPVFDKDGFAHGNLVFDKHDFIARFWIEKDGKETILFECARPLLITQTQSIMIFETIILDNKKNEHHKNEHHKNGHHKNLIFLFETSH